MAAVLRVGFRRWYRPWQRYASTFAEGLAAEEAHAVQTTLTWKRISLFVAGPGLVLCTYNAIMKEKEHAAHIKEHGRTEFLPYAHLRIRNKPFPWGDGNHSLIHNPHVNALPEGYEED